MNKPINQSINQSTNNQSTNNQSTNNQSTNNRSINRSINRSTTTTTTTTKRMNVLVYKQTHKYVQCSTFYTNGEVKLIDYI
jgi:organic radical activating enzyme